MNYAKFSVGKVEFDGDYYDYYLINCMGTVDDRKRIGFFMVDIKFL